MRAHELHVIRSFLHASYVWLSCPALALLDKVTLSDGSYNLMARPNTFVLQKIMVLVIMICNLPASKSTQVEAPILLDNQSHSNNGLPSCCKPSTESDIFTQAVC